MVQPASPAACPECASGRVARIVYEATSLEPELARQLAEGIAVLGGPRTRLAPRWECQDCQHRWGGSVLSADGGQSARDRLALRRHVFDLLDPPAPSTAERNR